MVEVDPFEKSASRDQRRSTMAIPDRATFEAAYEGRAPWDIDRPQRAFVDAADEITGSILDAGCGTGENALFFAARGRTVTGFDFLPGPIEQAKRKAAERGLAASFLVRDALALGGWPEAFDSAIDSGLFHVFNDDDRRRYVGGLASNLRPGGRLFLLCFSEEEPGDQGPRRVTQAEIDAAFSEGWIVESIEPAHYEVRPDHKDLRFSPGGAKAWFAVVRKAVE
jgi:SAM-dependent methyltransferase